MILNYKLSPLVLRRIALDAPKYKDVLDLHLWEDLVLRGMESGLAEIQDESAKLWNQTLVLTQKGVEESQQASLDEIFPAKEIDSAESTRRIMLAYMLFYGSHKINYYHSPSRFGEHFETLHVLSCGVSDQTAAPRDDSWSTFEGTYAESDEEHGLVAQITCQCGKIQEQDWVLYLGWGTMSTAELFVHLTSLAQSLDAK